MPLASDTKTSFGLSRTNPYGRSLLARQSQFHDKLVADAWMAPPIVEDKVLPIYMKQMETLHKAERFKPSYNQMKERLAQDLVMTQLLRDARPTSRHTLHKHTLKFRELRSRHPAYEPTFLEKYETTRTMKFHDKILEGSTKWVDDQLAGHIRAFKKKLSATAFTRGGFPRLAPTKAKRRKRRGRGLTKPRQHRGHHTFPPPKHGTANSTSGECSPTRVSSNSRRRHKAKHVDRHCETVDFQTKTCLIEPAASRALEAAGGEADALPHRSVSVDSNGNEGTADKGGTAAHKRGARDCDVEEEKEGGPDVAAGDGHEDEFEQEDCDEEHPKRAPEEYPDVAPGKEYYGDEPAVSTAQYEQTSDCQIWSVQLNEDLTK